MVAGAFDRSFGQILDVFEDGISSVRRKQRIVPV